MFVITKRQLIYFSTIITIFILLFAFSFKIARSNDTIETVSLPVSGKVIVIDAGHGVPDEGVSLLLFR